MGFSRRGDRARSGRSGCGSSSGMKLVLRPPGARGFVAVPRCSRRATATELGDAVSSRERGECAGRGFPAVDGGVCALHELG